ncbi:Lysophospholipase, alpha-beta hydrolase superfamily [Oceanobacillus limi]|uniref:Lysophospholipase, alpha-beta hydrolase superfamily n=1 Tax=Oceanobacillus limi TaxID=930131 RepID=A0A1I0BV90_9BACI|nr:alpha/beta hydrolase [Oceanobacillus limi]SET11068.1 Lysophospholipase, alpha-beta hydrolase superfamily [Oceanobacillus limi]
MKANFWLTMSDETEVYVQKWYDAKNSPKAIVQLAHGMVEHIERYDEFANFLQEQGIFVYGNDHRGHGKTGNKQGIMGFFAEEDGFSKTMNDLVEITNHIKQEYPSTPLYLFGHSMGSFLARMYIQQYSDKLDGLILSGTGYYNKASTLAGKNIALKLAPKEKSPFMNKLAFGGFNRKINNPKTNFDWLTRDQDKVKEYMQDEYNGFIPTGRFFYDLMTGLDTIHNQKNNKTIRADLPVFIISGDADPVGNYGKGVWKVAHLLTDAGLTNVTTMLFDGARHEVLNEVNRKEVYDTILEWIGH